MPLNESELSLIFHALADPSRRKMLELLREAGRLKVGDLALAFEMSLNGVSKHLKVLEKANVIQRQVEGRLHWVQVNWSALDGAADWLHSQKVFWQKRLSALEKHLEEKG